MNSACQNFANEIVRLANADGFSVSQRNSLNTDEYVVFVSNSKMQEAICISGLEAFLLTEMSAIELARNRYRVTAKRMM